MFFVGDSEEAAECGPVTGCGVLAELSSCVHELIGVEEVFAEAIAKVHSDVFHLAFATTVFLEMVIDTNPFLVVASEVLMVVGEEVLLGSVFVDEAKVTSEDGEFALGTEAFSGNHLLFVEFAFLCCARLANEVDAQVFAP